MKTKGEIIRDIRNYTGVSLRELGDMVGVTGASLSKYERGINKIPDEIITKICKCLKVDKKVFLDPDNIEKYCRYIPAEVDYDAIRERVRELRRENKMTRDEFVEHCGCSFGILVKIELNNTNPSDTVLQKIADGFDVGFDWLKYGDARTQKSPVNKRLIDWLNDNQRVRNALWKQMREAEEKAKE